MNLKITMKFRNLKVLREGNKYYIVSNLLNTTVACREEQIGLIFVTAFQSTDSKKVPLPLYIWPEKVLNMGVYMCVL